MVALLSVEKIQSLVTSAAVTSDGEDLDDFRARKKREERASMMASTITQDAERARQRGPVQDHGARVAFKDVKEYEWTWEGQDGADMEQAGEWKRKAYASITGKWRSAQSLEDRGLTPVVAAEGANDLSVFPNGLDFLPVLGDCGSEEDRRSVARLLLPLSKSKKITLPSSSRNRADLVELVSVCHPNTTPALAHKATQLLRRLIDYRVDAWTAPAAVLRAESLSRELLKLGVKADVFRFTTDRDGSDEMELDEAPPAAEVDAGEGEGDGVEEVGGEVLGVQARNLALRRWCVVLGMCLQAE